MKSLIFALNAVCPIILTVILGCFLKRIGLFTEDFAKKVNRLVFRVFLPTMLFLNVYNINSIHDINLGYVLFAVAFILATLLRCVIVPASALAAAYFVDRFSGAHFAAFVALFATPVAVSTVPMAQELKGDEALAGQLVVWTTIVSGFTIFLFTFLLKEIGVFA